MSGLQIRTTDLRVAYDGRPAISDVSLNLEPGRIHGLLGRNGAGKTTLLSALASLRPADGGSIRLGGAEPFENEAVMQRVCLIRESGDVIGDERITTNLDWFEMARPHFDRAYAERLLEGFGISLKTKPRTLSRGQASALGASIGLASRAEVTMFDEVHLGMDAPARQRFYDELLRDFVEHPRTIVISTHLINEVENLLETVTILHGGRLLLSEEADTLRERGATLTGPSDAVAAFTAPLNVLGTRDLGPTRQAIVYGELDDDAVAEASENGLSVGAVPLQDLFIHLTDSPAARDEREST